MYPERLDGGKHLLLVASEGHAHSEQVSMETEGMLSGNNQSLPRSPACLRRERESYSVLRWDTTSRLVNPACRKFCS